MIEPRGFIRVPFGRFDCYLFSFVEDLFDVEDAAFYGDSPIRVLAK